MPGGMLDKYSVSGSSYGSQRRCTEELFDNKVPFEASGFWALWSSRNSLCHAGRLSPIWVSRYARHSGLSLSPNNSGSMFPDGWLLGLRGVGTVVDGGKGVELMVDVDVSSISTKSDIRKFEKRIIGRHTRAFWDFGNIATMNGLINTFPGCKCILTTLR